METFSSANSVRSSPSTGTVSPGRTSSVSPRRTSATSRVCHWLLKASLGSLNFPVITFAVTGAASASAEMLFFARCSANVSITSPVHTITHKIHAAAICPVASVEIRAMITSISVPTLPDLRLCMILRMTMPAIYTDRMPTITDAAVMRARLCPADPAAHSMMHTAPTAIVMTMSRYRVHICMNFPRPEGFRAPGSGFPAAGEGSVSCVFPVPCISSVSRVSCPLCISRIPPPVLPDSIFPPLCPANLSFFILPPFLYHAMRMRRVCGGNF